VTTLASTSTVFHMGLPSHWRFRPSFAKTLEAYLPGISDAQSLSQLIGKKDFLHDFHRFIDSRRERRVLSEPRFHNPNLRFFGSHDAVAIASALMCYKESAELPQRGRKLSADQSVLFSICKDELLRLLRHPQIQSTYTPHNVSLTVHRKKRFHKLVLASEDTLGRADIATQRIACVDDEGKDQFFRVLTHELVHCTAVTYQHLLHLEDDDFIYDRSAEPRSGTHISIHSDHVLYLYDDLPLNPASLPKHTHHTAFDGLNEAIAEVMAHAIRMSVKKHHSHDERLDVLKGFERHTMAYDHSCRLFALLVHDIAHKKDERPPDVFARAFRAHACGGTAFFDDLLSTLGPDGFRSLARVLSFEKSFDELFAIAPRLADEYGPDDPVFCDKYILTPLEQLCEDCAA
jgi:hypothetical protein